MPFSPSFTSTAFVSHTSQLQSIIPSVPPSPSKISFARQYTYSLSSLYSTNLIFSHSVLNQKPSIMMPPFLSGIGILLATPLIALGILIILRVLFPAILKHPWTFPPKNSRQQKRDKEATVVFAGSFNPPHWGHLVMIKYLAERCVDCINLSFSTY